MGRRRRKVTKSERQRSSFHAIPWKRLVNPYAPLEIGSIEQIEQIHNASLDILETIGIDFLDAEALSIWEQAGAKVDHKAQHVWIDRGLVMELIALSPEQFTLKARNPARDMMLGGNHINFLPGGGHAFVSDLDGGKREGTREDFANILKLVQMCNVMHGTGVALIEMMDIPISHRHLHRVLMNFTLSDKPTTGAAHDRIIPQDVLSMARIVFGDAIMDNPVDPVVIGIVNVNSPLRFDDRMLGGLISYARAGQALIMTPFIIAGAMSPITIAAAVAQQNAEVLAGASLAQLVRPHTPVLYGPFSTNADMRSGSPAFGTPEGAWVSSIAAQLARFYKIPSRGNGGLTNANSNDAQSAYEALWTLWPTVMSHNNYIMHGAGWLETGLTISMEKLILDMENLAMFQHFLQGFEVSEETLALDMMAEIGPGGHHFGTSHTQARFSTEFYEPLISTRQALDVWRAQGAPDAEQRANHLWKQLLREYEPPPIDAGIKQGLDEYVARRERELEGVDLYY
ncbi:MAG: trimethylamine methyltransferase family protein [Chloroflexota bacterium]